MAATALFGRIEEAAEEGGAAEGGEASYATPAFGRASRYTAVISRSGSGSRRKELAWEVDALRREVESERGRAERLEREGGDLRREQERLRSEASRCGPLAREVDELRRENGRLAAEVAGVARSWSRSRSVRRRRRSRKR